MKVREGESRDHCALLASILSIHGRVGTRQAVFYVHRASILWDSLECDAQVDLLGPDRLQAHVFAPERRVTTQYPQVLKSIIRKSGIGYLHFSQNVIKTERRVKQTVTVVGIRS